MSLAKMVSKNIKALRLRAGLSQQALAEKTGLSVRYISRIENTSPNITLDNLERLSAGIGCSPAELVSRAGKGFPSSAKYRDSIDTTIKVLQSVKSALG